MTADKLTLRDRAGEASSEATPRPSHLRRLPVDPGPFVYRVVADVAKGGEARAVGTGWSIDLEAGQADAEGLPGPADILATALAACLSKNIERFTRILGFDYRGATVSVELERQSSPPLMIRASYLVQVDTEEPDHRLALLHHNIRKYGTVTNTLAAALELEGELRRA
jgi:uncharacterized OsmC-like protein